jgi:hypothetical protein
MADNTFSAPFWKLGMKLIIEDRCSINSKDGEVYISFRSHLKVANELDLWYELLIRENISGEQSDLLVDTLSVKIPVW